MSEWSAAWRQELDGALAKVDEQQSRCDERHHRDTSVTVQFCLTSSRQMAEQRIRASKRQALVHRVLVTAVPSSQNGESVSVYYVLHGTLKGIRQYLDAVDWELSPTACR